MPIGIYEKDDVDAVAKTIRNNLGDGTKYTVRQMPDAINKIQIYAYNSGHSEGKAEGREEGKAIGYAEGKTDGIAEGIEQGKKSQYDEFWDSFQLNGTRVNYPSLFAGSGWTDKTYNPKYEIIVHSLANNLFNQNTQITSTKVAITIDSDNKVNTNLFNGCTRLVIIPSIKVTEKVPVYTYWFVGCSSLKEVYFTEDSVINADISFVYSPLLISASVDNIINALKDLTGQSSKRVEFHSDVLKKMTDEQFAKITAKNWTM